MANANLSFSLRKHRIHTLDSHCSGIMEAKIAYYQFNRSTASILCKQNFQNTYDAMDIGVSIGFLLMKGDNNFFDNTFCQRKRGAAGLAAPPLFP